MKLTKTLVEQAQPKASKYWLADSLVPGLGVSILPAGTKTYYLRYRTLAGEQRTLKLGRSLEFTPDDARRLAREALAQVREGKDPAAARQQLRTAPTLHDLATRYQQEHASRKASGGNDEILWRRHLLPALGRHRVATITRDQIRQYHQQHPRPVTANRSLEVLDKAMTLAEEWGWRPPGTNPCKGIAAHPERKRERYLSMAELSRLRDALVQWEADGNLTTRWRFAQLVRLLLLTGARLNEIMAAPWTWVDWQRQQLVVPADSHKTGHHTGATRRIVLSDRAIEILQALQEAQWHRGQWIIEGAQPEHHLVGYRRLWLALLQDAGITDLRIHDLRHTFASYTLSHGQTLGTVGQLLGHRSAQTTTRYAHLIDDAAQRAVAQVSSDLAV